MDKTVKEAFDPYHKWLGIPPQDQPPHYYRLLGVDLFEADADVIANAADGRMAQIKNFQAGKHSAVSQRILNEIATAKVCLLSGPKKAEYDRTLRQRLQSPQGAGSPPPAPPVPAAAQPDLSSALGIPDLGFAATSSRPSTTGRGRKKKPQPFPWPIAVAIGGVVLVLGGILVYLLTAGGGHNAAHGTSPDDNLATATKSSSDVAKSVPVKSVVVPGKTVVAIVTPKINEKSKPGPEEKPDPPTPEDPKPENPPVKPEPEDPPQPPQKPEEPKKLAVPGAAEQKEAEKKIKDILHGDFVKANTPEGTLDLAKKLSETAAGTKDDPVARFVLSRLAYENFAAAGKLKQAFDEIDRLEEKYEFDGSSAKTALVDDVAKKARPSQESAEAALGLAEAAAQEGNYPLAEAFLRLASKFNGGKHTQVMAEIVACRKRLKAAKDRFAAAQPFLKTLETTPDDPQANLEVGLYWLTEGDFEKALPLLAKGTQESLADLAKQELAQPGDPEAQLALGDTWDKLAEQSRGPAERKEAIKEHVKDCYEQALPKLSGLDKRRVEAWLTQYAEAHSSRTKSPPPARGGVFEPGNVALASRGAKVTGTTQNDQFLLDGVVKNSEYAWSPFPCRWVITLGKVYSLKHIRFLPYNGDNRYVQYRLYTSRDGRKFDLLADESKGQCRGWQEIPCRPARAVKVIVLEGLFSDVTRDFHVIELEAYCTPRK